MLSQIKHFLRPRSQATLLEIARHLGASPMAVQPMLSHWIRKGRVKKLPKPNGCGVKCVKCEPFYAVVYCWVEPISAT